FSCCCSAFNKMLSFHCFPKDPELRAQWLMKIRRHGFIVTTSSRVCSRHFETGDIFVSSCGKRCLQPKVVPSLFHWNNFSKKTEHLEICKSESEWVLLPNVEQVYNIRKLLRCFSANILS
uniref:THAP domain-containing protein 1 n=1 Tax=Haplochromis burtoni TaxID=8153 RepID=A0A3Q3BVG7_HAPBU